LCAVLLTATEEESPAKQNTRRNKTISGRKYKTISGRKYTCADILWGMHTVGKFPAARDFSHCSAAAHWISDNITRLYIRHCQHRVSHRWHQRPVDIDT
jgi:hypothetical protein